MQLAITCFVFRRLKAASVYYGALCDFLRLISIADVEPMNDCIYSKKDITFYPSPQTVIKRFGNSVRLSQQLIQMACYVKDFSVKMA